MKKHPVVALLAVVAVAGLLLALLASCLHPFPPPGSLSSAVSSPVAPGPSQTPVPTVPVVLPWEWAKPGFGGSAAITLTQGMRQYVYYGWSPSCDAPARRQVPMIWGKTDFYTNTAALADLFNGPCNDGRPLFFLNEPAKAEQANIIPAEAAHMFYTMTRGLDWPYERWHGPIYAGNNLVEEREWDAEFVRQFANLHNGGRLTIPEIAGWGVHLYGNYEYGPRMGDPNVVWTEDIPAGDIPEIVDRSMKQLDRYLSERKAEGNSTRLVVSEFGLLQASAWHTPPALYYSTTAAFMDEYVRRFDSRHEVEAWMWFISMGSKDLYLDTDAMVDESGALTPNGVKWRELARERQP